MTNKERFDHLYHDIHRSGADELYNYLQRSDFFTAPASTRFHGNYEGGLLEHSLNVYDCLLKMLETVCPERSYPDETILIVSLLHDLCKTNFYKPGTRNVKNPETGKWETKEVYEIDEMWPLGDHSDKSLVLIQNFMHLTTDEIYAIRAHMGFSDATFKGGSQMIGRIFEKCPLALALHMADMMATYTMEEKR